MNDRDRELFRLLDNYVNSLGDEDSSAQTFQAPDELLHSYPELADLLDCLDSLESLAVPPAHLMDGSAAVPVAGDRSDKGRQASDDAAHRDFGRYELLSEVGRGGMGVIYRARQKVLGSVVALKMIRSSQLASQDEVRRFYQEARAAAGLRHPNIVSVHDVGEVGGQHFLTMDFVDGGSLADRLREGPLDPEPAAEMLLCVAQAVQYLHDHQIIHRDLKPSNIVLDQDGVPFVTDFGLAKVFEADSQDTASGTILGTPSYMAPEQAAGRLAQVSPRSDVYSLGAILYEMLTGRPPFSAENPLDTVLQVLESEPVAPTRLVSSVPSDLEELCLRCLEKEPEARFASASELASELQRYLQGEPVAARTTSLGRRCRRWARREPALVSRLAVLSVAAIVVQINYHLNGESLHRHLLVMGMLALWVLLSFLFQRLLNHSLRAADVERQQVTPVHGPASPTSSGSLQTPHSALRLPSTGTSILSLNPVHLTRAVLSHRDLLMRAGWAAADAICFTGTLLISPEPIGPLLIGYPVLVVASGLWFEVGLVWFMTLICTLSYGVLTINRFETGTPRHYPYIFAVALLGTGFIVAYQVFRIRALSRYFDRRFHG